MSFYLFPARLFRDLEVCVHVRYSRRAARKGFSGVSRSEPRKFIEVNPKGHESPVCVPAVSQVISSAVLPSGALTAVWTRKLSASGQGVAPIAPGQSFHAIAAWGSEKNRQAAPCAGGWPEHSHTGDATLKF